MLKTDLHMHTTYSDGRYTPTELIELAHSKELQVISITDHDSINAYKEAFEAAKDYNIELITGLEISTDIEDTEVHLLAYFVDTKGEELNKYLDFFREERFQRAKRIVKKLQNLGLKITIDDVMDLAKNSAIGRPHIASTLLELKLVSNFYQAFDLYLGNNAPAYERKIHVSAQSALKLISDAGGLSFIAHPGGMDEYILTKLIKAGVDGIEVLHPSHSRYQIKFYRGIVNQYCLLESGGSDFHGGDKGDDVNFGKYYISSAKIEAMKKMLV